MINFEMNLTKKYTDEYKKASKERKGQILDEYCKLTNIKRNTAVRRIYRYAKKAPMSRIVTTSEKRGRKKKYIAIHQSVLKKAWKLSGNLCAELMFPKLERFIHDLRNADKLKHISNKDIAIAKNVSLGTLKNIIAEFPNPNTRNYKGKSSVYRLVPIDANFRRFTKQPGNIEIDYVEHNGGHSSGRFGFTGTYVGLFAQWLSRAAGWGKNQESIDLIFEKATSKIYHQIHRFHPDNCPSTLRCLVNRYCRNNNCNSVDTGVSRSRPYKKNDNAHVEQKNGNKVRKNLGYRRFDTQEEVDLLNQYYDVEDLISNFFIPNMKLHCKFRNERGKVVKKVYQKPATPYERLIRSAQINDAVKSQLEAMNSKLNLVKLREKSDKIKSQLFNLSTKT